MLFRLLKIRDSQPHVDRPVQEWRKERAWNPFRSAAQREMLVPFPIESFPVAGACLFAASMYGSTIHRLLPRYTSIQQLAKTYQVPL